MADSEPTRILVTGGAGFIGSHAAKALAAAGHLPVVVDNLRTGHRSAVRWGPFEHGDILDEAFLAQVMKRHRIEAVMHFAALAYVGESNVRPDLYYRTNVAGTLCVLEAMRIAGVHRIVLSSTCATYGVSEALPIVEATRLEPISPYGASKLMAERIVADHAHAFGLGAVALRYFNAAGADPDGELGEEHDPETHLIPSILQVAAGRRSHIDIFGDDYPTPDGTCVRDYIHVCDLAYAHGAALANVERGRFKAFNLASGRGYSVSEVIEAARRITNRPIEARVAPRRPNEPPVLYADASLAAATFGWHPARSDLDTMIADAWAWMVKSRGTVASPSHQSP